MKTNAMPPEFENKFVTVNLPRKSNSQLIVSFSHQSFFPGATVVGYKFIHVSLYCSI